MKIGGSDRTRREKAFHHNDDESITVDDLWEAWFQSEERNWTEKEVIEWLKNSVKLPQYTNNFLAAKVFGIALPRCDLVFFYNLILEWQYKTLLTLPTFLG